MERREGSSLSFGISRDQHFGCTLTNVAAELASQILGRRSEDSNRDRPVAASDHSHTTCLTIARTIRWSASTQSIRLLAASSRFTPSSLHERAHQTRRTVSDKMLSMLMQNRRQMMKHATTQSLADAEGMIVDGRGIETDIGKVRAEADDAITPSQTYRREQRRRPHPHPHQRQLQRRRRSHQDLQYRLDWRRYRD